MYDMSLVIPCIVLLGGVIILYVCHKLNFHKTMKVLAVIFAVLLTASAGFSYMSIFKEDPVIERSVSSDRIKYYQAVGHIIGKEITGKCLVENQSLIIAGNRYYNNKYHVALINELAKQIKVISKEPMVDFIKINNKREKYKSSHFNHIFRKYWNFDLFVSIEGLPDDMNLSIWQDLENKKSIPKLVVFTENSNIKHMKDALKKKLIYAIITKIPGDNSKLEDKAPKKMEDAFDKHFIMVTPVNMDRMAEKHPGLFEG